MKSLPFTLVLIMIFIFVYIKNVGLDKISIPKLLLIPLIMLIAYMIDRRLENSGK